MPLIIWDSTLSVGHAEIDAQHQKWVAILNKLHDAYIDVNNDDFGRLTIEALKEMLDYCRYHFAFEEEYMGKINYPLIANHWRLHKDFDSKLNEYYNEINGGRLVLTSEIIKTLKDWLLNHIAIEDKKYQASVSSPP